MQLLRLPSAQYVTKLIRDTEQDTLAAVLRHYSTDPAVWSYNPVRRMAKAVFSGEVSLAAATHGCLTSGHKGGRQYNAEVARHVWETAESRTFYCHDLSKQHFAINKDLRLAIDPQFFFVEKGVVKLFWLQPCRAYAPTHEGLGTLAAMVRATFTDLFDDFDLEFLDLSRPPGEKNRVRRVYSLADLPNLSDKTIQDALDRFARAYQIACEMDIPPHPKRPRPDTGHPDSSLFDARG